VEISMHLTLRHKVNGAIIITFLLIVILFTAIQLPFQQNRLQNTIDGIQVLLQTLVERDTEQLANEIFDTRVKAIRLRIKQMRSVDGILGISVFNRAGKLLVSEGVAVLRQEIAPHEIRKIDQHPQMEEEEWQGESALFYTKTINFLGEKLGFIRIHYSLKNLDSDRRNSFLIFGGLLATILMVMLIVLNWILSRAILRPIMTLLDATRFIARGNLENDIDMTRKDELGNLAQSFAIMRDAIKEKISDLERLTGIIESTSDLVGVATPDNRAVYINRAGKKMLGWPENEPLNDRQITEFHPDWAFDVIDKIGIPASIKNGTWEGETVLVRADGRQIPVSQVLISHLSADGELKFVSTVIRDISEPKKAEEELRILRNYLANIIDSMPSVLIGVDKEGCVTQWNAEAQRATGVSPEKALGLPLVDAFPRLAPEEKRVYQAMQNRRMLSDSKQASLVNGKTRFEDVTIFPLVGGGLEGAVIRIDDVTDKVNMEEMMIQSEKMLSVGGLAAGMAHEINNPLAGMMQAANLLSSRLTDEKVKANLEAADAQGISMKAIRAYMESRNIPSMLDQIRESGIRASKIVTNMLSFARKSDAASGTHSLPKLLDKTADLAGSDYDLKKKFDFRQIEIIREYEEGLPDIPCDPGKIQQVLLNILRNGAEAMQEAREKSGDDSSAHKKPHFIFRIAKARASGTVRIEIRDNGPGMDEEVRKRIFEPFFTTKPTGSGTGLGLSVSYFIITENHSGSMSVESALGQGTKFVIHLPLTS